MNRDRQYIEREIEHVTVLTMNTDKRNDHKLTHQAATWNIRIKDRSTNTGWPKNWHNFCTP